MNTMTEDQLQSEPIEAANETVKTDQQGGGKKRKKRKSKKKSKISHPKRKTKKLRKRKNKKMQSGGNLVPLELNNDTDSILGGSKIKNKSKKKISKWIQHVLSYAKVHNLPFKTALKSAKNSYKK